MSIIQLLPFDVSAKHSLWVKVKIKPTILTHMERRIKYLIRISTGRDISFHHSHQRAYSYLIQIPPRAFSHRSSSHVLPYEDLGTHYWALFIPRLYSQRMVFYFYLWECPLPLLAFPQSHMYDFSQYDLSSIKRWWARLDSNQRCFKSHGFTARYPRR